MIGFWIINAIMAILSILCFGYQFYYLLISLLKPAKRFPEGERNRFAVLIAAMRDRSLAARVTAVGFLAAYLPWVGISRTTFIYHYFSAVPMLCLALVYVCWKLDQSAKPLPAIGPIKTNAVTLSMAGFMLLLFIFWCLFWPVISGSPTSSEAVHALEWLPGWYFAP